MNNARGPSSLPSLAAESTVRGLSMGWGIMPLFDTGLMEVVVARRRAIGKLFHIWIESLMAYGAFAFESLALRL